MGRPKEVSDQQILAVARRCFLERGAGISAAEIARELGVSHTTLFNRFGSKERLLIEALGLNERAAWVEALDAGPDDRPFREQLVEHTKAMSAFFEDFQASLAMLRAAGIDLQAACPGREAPATQGYQALIAWLKRAQGGGKLALCDVETLASTILGALHARTLAERLAGRPTSAADRERQAERLIDLLWNGIGVGNG